MSIWETKQKRRDKEIIQYNPEIKKEDVGAIKCQSTVINCFLNKIFICYISRISCCEENTFVIINIRIGWLKYYRSLTNHINRDLLILFFIYIYFFLCKNAAKFMNNSFQHNKLYPWIFYDLYVHPISLWVFFF